MSRFLRFSEFELNEKTQFVNLENTSGKNSLGSLDTSELKKITQIKNILMPDIKPALQAFLASKNIPAENTTQIQNLITKYFIGETSALLDYLDPKKSSEQLYKYTPVNGGHTPVSTVIDFYRPLFHEAFFKHLIELEGKGKPVVGRNELFYMLMMDKYNNSTTAGDLRADVGIIEVKQKKGRFGGTKGTLDGVSAMNQIRAAFKKHYKYEISLKTKGFGKGTGKEIMAAYNEINKPSYDFIKDLIIGIANYDRKYIVHALTKPNMDFFINILKSNDIEQMAAYVTALHLLGYAGEEKFDWLYIMTNDREHICTIKTKGTSIKEYHKFTSTYFVNSISWANTGPDRMGASIGDIKI